jgi:dGTPase
MADLGERAERWASTMTGHAAGTIAFAHADSWAGTGSRAIIARTQREEAEDHSLAPLATRAAGAGNRAIDEQPDAWRTCFERDRDRILHASAFRRLAGKTQVFVFPDDHQRTRLTHALEVAQVATSVARALGLNVVLTEAIALGHDCGHGRLRPRGLGRRHHLEATEPLRRDTRRHPQPLLVAAGAYDSRR